MRHNLEREANRRMQAFVASVGQTRRSLAPTRIADDILGFAARTLARPRLLSGAMVRKPLLGALVLAGLQLAAAAASHSPTPRRSDAPGRGRTMKVRNRGEAKW